MTMKYRCRTICYNCGKPTTDKQEVRLRKHKVSFIICTNPTCRHRVPVTNCRFTVYAKDGRRRC